MDTAGAGSFCGAVRGSGGFDTRDSQTCSQQEEARGICRPAGTPLLVTSDGGATVRKVANARGGASGNTAEIGCGSL